MERKHIIAFRTFKNYCKHQIGKTFPICGKTDKSGMRGLWCKKKNCPVFKRLKVFIDINGYYRRSSF
jgi:hypothetical protein